MSSDQVNILFTSSGRRVTLIKQFQEMFKRNRLAGNIITADCQHTAPTAFVGARHYNVPRITDGDYIPQLLRICQEEQIALLVPLIDPELTILSRHRQLFTKQQVKLLLSSNECNELCFDKVKTYHFFLQHGIPTPKIYSETELKERKYQFPLIVKPRNGSSGQGVTKVTNDKELDFFTTYISEAMVQDLVIGDEYTIDVMVDNEGHIKTAVPRLRMEIRAGEVSKGMTVKDNELIEAAKNVVRLLPGALGCITLQCFKKLNGEVMFIEINPRFGGGVPLAIEAGADFPLWCVQLSRDEPLSEPDYTWLDQLTMLRFDDAVFRQDVI